MKNYLPIIIAVFTINAFSQETPKPDFPKWTFGPSFAFISYDNIKAQSGFAHTYSYNKSELGMGLDIDYHFSKRSVISTGIVWFFNLNYEVNYVWENHQPGDPLIPQHTYIESHYFDIPVMYNFSFIRKDKFEIYSITGIASSIFSNIKDSTTYYDNSVRNSDLTNPFIMSLQFGLGFQYNVKNEGYIKLEPQYRTLMKGFDEIMYQHPTAFYATISVVAKIDWKCFFKKGAWKPLPVCD